MRALTVRQPYADAIVHGEKRTENRSKAIPGKYLGTTILIHAGKEPHASGITAADLGSEDWPDVRGAILATARLDSCHRAEGACCAPWGHQETDQTPIVWHWQLDDVRPLETPVPATGALGLWTLKGDALYDVQVQFWASSTSKEG